MSQTHVITCANSMSLCWLNFPKCTNVAMTARAENAIPPGRTVRTGAHTRPRMASTSNRVAVK